MKLRFKGYGYFPVLNSYKINPKLHKSLEYSYSNPCILSGDLLNINFIYFIEGISINIYIKIEINEKIRNIYEN